MEWAAVSGLVGVLVGLVLGNRLALGRDKRKEFNEVTKPMRGMLRAQINAIERGIFENAVLSGQIDEIVAALGEERSDKIVSAYNRYQATYEKNVISIEFRKQLASSPGSKQELLEDARRLYAAIQPS